MQEYPYSFLIDFHLCDVISSVSSIHFIRHGLFYLAPLCLRQLNRPNSTMKGFRLDNGQAELEQHHCQSSYSEFEEW